MAWSEWQDAWDMPFNVPRSSYLVGKWWRGSTPAWSEALDPDSLVDGLTTLAQTGDTWEDTAPSITSHYALNIEKRPPSVHSPAGVIDLSVAFAYDAVTLRGSRFVNQFVMPPGVPPTARPIPPVLYEWDKPVVGGLVQYETFTTTFAHWDDVIYPATMTQSDGPAPGTDSNAPYLPATFPFVVGSVPVLATRHLVYRSPASDGVPLYVGPSVPYSALTPLGYVNAPTDGSPVDVPVALSSVSARDLSLVVVSRFLDPANAIDRPHVSLPGAAQGWVQIKAQLNSQIVTGWGYSFYVYNPLFGGITPVIRYTSPRWRYWLGSEGWHTAGGHWTDPGGAQLSIFTPGDGGIPSWVPVVDGPG